MIRIRKMLRMALKEIDPSWGIALHQPREVDRTYIPMRDGIRLYVEVFRPDSEGPFPTILIRNPYHDVSIPPNSRDKHSHEEFVRRGYAVVEAEVRGTGISEGKFRFLVNDGPDGYDTIRWIRAQPWSNGKIGTVGNSYLGMDQLFLAAEHPPGLKAMFVGYAGADIYHEAVYPGGILNMLMIRWSIIHLAHITPPNVPGLLRFQEEKEEEILGMMRRINHARARIAVESVSKGRGLYDIDFLHQWMENETYGQFWEAQSPGSIFEKISTPIYCYGGWFDFFIRGTIRSYTEINAPKKLIIGPWFHAGREGFDMTGTQLRWFDYWLKGRENGIMDEPPIRAYVLGRDKWIFQSTWPPKTREKRYFLSHVKKQGVHKDNEGILVCKAPRGQEPDPINHDPDNPIPTISQRKGDISEAEKLMLSYTTGKLEKGLEIAGPPILNLFASTDSGDVDWIAKLTEVRPGGKSTVFTSGALRGSHFQSHREPHELISGKIYNFKIEMMPIWKVFHAGSRIRVDIGNSDFPNFYPNRIPSSNFIHHNVNYPSQLVLPVIN